MNGFERICLYFVRAVKHFRPILLLIIINLVTDIALITIVNWYLISIIILGDIIRFACHGAWYCAPAHETASFNPARSDAALYTATIKFSIMVTIIACVTYNVPAAVTCLLFYCVTFVNTRETMRRILLTMNKHNDSWLAGTDGRIGLANECSIERIVIAVVLPHLFWARPFGKWNLIAEILLLGACFISDAIDGWIARRYGTETRAGRYLDPLGDKILFVPLGITLTLMASRFNLEGNRASFTVITLVCIAIAIIRDILFFIWFFTMRRRNELGMKAGIVDKLRMITICAWLGAMALAYAAHSMSKDGMTTLMIEISFILVLIVAIVSIASVYVDIGRMKRQIRAGYYRRSH